MIRMYKRPQTIIELIEHYEKCVDLNAKARARNEINNETYRIIKSNLKVFIGDLYHVLDKSRYIKDDKNDRQD